MLSSVSIYLTVPILQTICTLLTVSPRYGQISVAVGMSLISKRRGASESEHKCFVRFLGSDALRSDILAPDLIGSDFLDPLFWYRLVFN